MDAGFLPTLFHWIPFVWFNPLVGPMSAIAERSLTILVDGGGSSTLRWSGRPFRRVRLEQSVNSFNQQLTADGAEWKCSICRLVYSQVGKLPCIKMLINPLKYSLIFHIIIINIWIWTLSLSLLMLLEHFGRRPPVMERGEAIHFPLDNEPKTPCNQNKSKQLGRLWRHSHPRAAILAESSTLRGGEGRQRGGRSMTS